MYVEKADSELDFAIRFSLCSQPNSYEIIFISLECPPPRNMTFVV